MRGVTRRRLALPGVGSETNPLATSLIVDDPRPSSKVRMEPAGQMVLGHTGGEGVEHSLHLLAHLGTAGGGVCLVLGAPIAQVRDLQQSAMHSSADRHPAVRSAAARG